MSREATSEQLSVCEGAGYDRSSKQAMSLMRAFPGRQRGKRQPILLTRKWKVVMEGKVRRRR